MKEFELHGLDLIFLALVAGILIFRLYSTLGKEDDTTQERIRNIHQNLERELQEAAEAQLDEQENHSFDEELRHFSPQEQQILAQLHEQWSGFVPSKFLDGAKKAYIFIIESFANGDKKGLKPLLSNVLYTEFAKIIDKRKDKGEVHEHTVNNIPLVRFVEAKLVGEMAQITLDFQSFQTHMSYNKDGDTLYETGEDLEELWDRWTFTRDITKPTPRWTLVNIESTPQTDRKEK